MKFVYLIFTCFTLMFANLMSMTPGEYASWWRNYQHDEKIPFELREMEDYCLSTGLLLEQSSNYWNHLNCYNIQQISAYGYENFKQTVSRNYFTWVVSLNHPYAMNLKKNSKGSKERLDRSELNKIHPFFGKKESFLYNKITEAFINYVLTLGLSEQLNALEEPLIGNPPYVLYKNKRVSQDILNSLLEYHAVNKNVSLSDLSVVLEVGAGSGRTAFCLLTLEPHLKYIIVDFPPALYVSQKYLSDVFHDRKIFKFRPFSSFDDVKKEFDDANIIFLTPDQIEKLPDNSVDLFLAIDCLHEMRPQVIERYFEEADRLATYFYYKCWQKTTVPYDGIFYSRNSYPVRPFWKSIFSEDCVVPSDFFHALYKLKL